MTDDRQALWQREDHVRAREADIGEGMRDRLTVLDGLPPALRREYEQTFIVHSTYLETLQTDMEGSGQEAAILRQRVRHAPARSAPPMLAPRTAPRQRGTGTRPAAHRAAGPRSGTDPGDDGPSHEPPPPPDAPRADGSDQHEGRDSEEANR